MEHVKSDDLFIAVRYLTFGPNATSSNGGACAYTVTVADQLVCIRRGTEMDTRIHTIASDATVFYQRD